MRHWTVRLAICGLVIDSAAGYFYCKRTEALWAVTTVCRVCGPQVSWICADDVCEVLVSLYVSQLRLFCTLAQFQHQIVAVTEVREMPSAVQQRTDEAILAEYDLAPEDMQMVATPRPSALRGAGGVRPGGLGLGLRCAMADVRLRPACQHHLDGCPRGPLVRLHQAPGHVMADVRLGRLV